MYSSGRNWLAWSLSVGWLKPTDGCDARLFRKYYGSSH
jgi:hypothetical protein